jgi:hypothetical protein
MFSIKMKFLGPKFAKNNDYNIDPRMPVRFEDCSPEVQKLLKQRRMPKGSVKKEKEIDFAFDPMKYAK